MKFDFKSRNIPKKGKRASAGGPKKIDNIIRHDLNLHFVFQKRNQRLRGGQDIVSGTVMSPKPF
jgi:hypothetical protein